MIAKSYPYQLVTIFVTQAHFSRPSVISDKTDLPVKVEVKIGDDKEHPERLQAFLRVELKHENLSISVEIIGLFDCTDPEKLCDQKLRLDFLKEKGLFILFTYISQIIHIVTGQMGMNPIRINMPPEFPLEPLEEQYLKSSD